MHATNTCYNRRQNLLPGLVLAISIIGLANRSAHKKFHYVQFSCTRLYLLTTYLNTILIGHQYHHRMSVLQLILECNLVVCTLGYLKLGANNHNMVDF